MSLREITFDTGLFCKPEAGHKSGGAAYAVPNQTVTEKALTEVDAGKMEETKNGSYRRCRFTKRQAR